MCLAGAFVKCEMNEDGSIVVGDESCCFTYLGV